MHPQPAAVLVALALLAGAAACSGVHEPAGVGDRARATGPPVRAVPVLPTLNVPGLLRLTVEEMDGRIGPRLPVGPGFSDPVATPPAQRNELPDSTALFRYQGLAIVASFDSRTRRVSDLLLLGNDEDELMRRAQLHLNAKRYLVVPVFQVRRPTELFGLRVLAVEQ